MRLIDADAKTFPIPYKYNDTKYAEGWNACLTSITQQPTIEAEPVVHGHWIYDHWCEFKCSNCGHWSDSKPYKGRENYCPNCGAKMDGGTLCE